MDKFYLFASLSKLDVADDALENLVRGTRHDLIENTFTLFPLPSNLSRHSGVINTFANPRS